MKKINRYAIIYLIGGLYYAFIEILWRGYSHWTMILTGGLCVLCLYVINEKCSGMKFFVRCFLGCIIITAAEFIVGAVVNKMLLWNVWDYSDKSYNIMGQISLNSSLLWFALCIPAFAACTVAEAIFNDTRDHDYGKSS